VDALPRRTGREARIKFGDEPAIDARNAAGFGCGFVTRVAFTLLCCAGENCASQKFADCGTGEYVLWVFLTTIITVIVTTRADGENTGFAVWIPVASPSSLHSTIAFDLQGVVVG
jgi:hypothetical protein